MPSSVSKENPKEKIKKQKVILKERISSEHDKAKLHESKAKSLKRELKKLKI